VAEVVFFVEVVVLRVVFFVLVGVGSGASEQRGPRQMVVKMMEPSSCRSTRWSACAWILWLDGVLCVRATGRTAKHPTESVEARRAILWKSILCGVKMK
jgi:hypothetical protein